MLQITTNYILNRIEIQLCKWLRKYVVSRLNIYLYFLPCPTNTNMRKKWTDEIQGTYCVKFLHKFHKNTLKV